MAGRKRSRTWLWLVLVIAAAGSGWWVWQDRQAERAQAREYRLAEVQQGKLVAQVSASGTLNAVTTVQVGSQVSGQIKEMLVDYNSVVTKGQLIARIDPVKFAAKVSGSEAELKVARSNLAIKRAAVSRAEAELGNGQSSLAAARAQVTNAQVAVADTARRLKRQRALLKSSAVSQSTVDDAEAAHDKALAQLKTAQAQEAAAASSVSSRRAALKMAQAEVGYARSVISQQEAALAADRVDLANTEIRSPVDGVVIKRSVDVGQTVAASLQAPELFIIAQDLSQMEVDANIDEADIGRVGVGQPVTYTVDAFPGRQFEGRVAQIRKSPNTVQNVVTYTVVISAANPQRLLLPGMTANVKITVAQRGQTLMVPNAALRFRPREGEAEAAAAQGSSGSLDTGREKAQPTAPAGDRRAAAAQRLARLAKALDLDKAQTQALTEMTRQTWRKISELRAKGLSRDEIKAEAARLRDQNHQSLLALLNPEQREKLVKLTANRARAETTTGRVWLLSKSGRPRPKDLTLGITDGAFTEVIKGDLQAGQKVITGHALLIKGKK